MSKIEKYTKINYEEAWKVLNNLFTVLRRENEGKIPVSVVHDLRSAKTMTHILEAAPLQIENLSRIETYFNKVESNLILVAEERFGSDYAERWIRMLEKAKSKPIDDEEEQAVYKLVESPVKDEPWVRIQVSEDLLQEKIERLAEENELLHMVQMNGYLHVYGDREKLKTFIKKMAEKLGDHGKS